MLYKSNIFSQASGSLDGTVFSHNSSGRYVRNRTIPTNPNTARQAAIRTTFGFTSSIWSTFLTQDQRDSWEPYAKNVPFTNRVGDQIFLSPFNHFCRQNVARSNASLPGVFLGPTELTLPEHDPAFNATASADGQLLEISFNETLTWVSEDGAGLLVSVGLPQPPSRNFFATPYRFADAIGGDSSSPETSPVEINSPWTLGTGQKIWIRARITRADGRLSTFFTTTTIVEAL